MTAGCQDYSHLWARPHLIQYKLGVTKAKSNLSASLIHQSRESIRPFVSNDQKGMSLLMKNKGRKLNSKMRLPLASYKQPVVPDYAPWNKRVLMQ